MNAVYAAKEHKAALYCTNVSQFSPVLNLLKVFNKLVHLCQFQPVSVLLPELNEMD